MIALANTEPDYEMSFLGGLQRLRNLFKVMIEDVKLSSNYDNTSTEKFISSKPMSGITEKSFKEVHLLIASPSDVQLERELLLDKLETKFRRDHFEERCGARIIVTGREALPSQMDILRT